MTTFGSQSRGIYCQRISFMHGFQKYANVSWPKADIETESKCVFLNGCFRGEKRTLGLLARLDPGRFHLIFVHLVS